MFCNNCGNKNEGGSEFCPICGARVTSDNVSGLQSAIQPVPQQDMQQVVTTTSSSKKAKKKGGLVALLIVLVVLIGCVLAVVLNIKAIKNLYYKTTLSPDEYCQYVLKEAAHSGAAIIARSYNQSFYSAIFLDNTKTSTGMTINTSEDGVKLLEDLSDERGFELLTDLDGKYTVQHKGEFMSSNLSVTAEGKEILTIDMIFDQDNEIVYLGIPTAGTDYMSFKLKDFYDRDEIEELYDNLDMIAAVGEVSIKPDELRTMIERYQDIAIENIEGVTIGSEELTIEDVSQKLTTLEFTADIELLANITLDVIDELANDEEIEEYYYAYAKAVDYKDADDDYDDFLDELDDMKDEVEDTDFDDIENEIKVVLYVNGLGNIAGIRINTEIEDYDWYRDKYVTNDVEWFCGYTVAGGKFGFLMDMLIDDDEEWSVTGSGTVRGNKFTGDFDIDYSILNVDFSIKDVDVSKIDQGVVSGSVIIDLHQFKKFGLPSELKNTNLMITLNQTNSSEKITIALTDDKDNNLISLSSYTISSGKADVATPNSTVECDDARDIRKFLEKQDFSVLIDRLESYGVEDADDAIDELIDEIEDAGTAPIELLYIPEIGVTNVYTPMLSGVMVPSLIKYIEKSKVSSDIQLADTIQTACLTALLDPEVVNDRCYNDVYEELYYGTYITDWGRPSNKYQEAVADILGISDFSELEDKIRSDYSGDGIYVEYDGYSSVMVELRNTDRYGHGDLSGWCNITVY